jgi:hypothetical protein
MVFTVQQPMETTMSNFPSSERASELRYASHAVSASEHTEAILALTPEITSQAFRIRHQGYLSYGYITARDDGMFRDMYDGQENERTVVIYRNGAPAATIRVCLYDKDGVWPQADRIPALEIFGCEIDELQNGLLSTGQPRRIVEITRFARLPEFANDRSIIIAAFRTVAYLRLYFGASIMLNAVRSHHMPTYRRLGFRQWGEPKQYPNLTYKAGLMAMFKSDFQSALGKIGLPSGVAVSDPIYQELFAGERVCVFDDMRSRNAIQDQSDTIGHHTDSIAA